MNKYEVLKHIVDNEDDVCDKSIVKLCKETLNKQINVYNTKVLIDSASFLIEQIEQTNHFIDCAKFSKDVQAYERSKAKYIESLQKVINKL